MTDIYDAHRHLYHYTNFEGLKGILESRTLWATHYKALNDFSEVERMRDVVEQMALETLNPVAQKRVKESFRFRRNLDKHGGIVALLRTEAQKIVSSFYSTMFEGRLDKEAFAEPYIVSFCAHTNETEYVKNNGLLSMWRAYGDAGGYALVFDCKRLVDRLKAEWRHYAYSGFHFSDVVYDDDVARFGTEFSDLNSALESYIHAWLKGSDDANPIEVFVPFFNSVTRFKHQGFKEEHEVRLAVAPIPAHVFSTTEAEGTEKIEKKQKPILFRQKGSKRIAYIVLNDVPRKKALPIVKIIVGPQRDQQKRMKEFRRIVGRRRIEVACSETPFIPT